jgi:hypothetical protein
MCHSNRSLGVVNGGAASRRRLPARSALRRGVSSVLAMMFMVVFSSLTAVMAVVAQGNLRTAESGLRLSRAMSAAETGLVFAARRLEEQGSRFVIEKGVVDASFASDLWEGTYDEGADGAVDVLAPAGFVETVPATSLAQAMLNAHDADTHDMIVDEALDPSLPAIDEYGTLRVRPIQLDAADDTVYFRLKYEMLADEPLVRVTSQGVDGDITRTLQMDFQINKRIEYAVISPNRIMIGKNVRVEGPLGSRYGLVEDELGGANSHPLVMRSDFYYLDDALDAVLDVFHDAVAENDADGDGRLRPGHASESAGLLEHPELVDYDGDEYVDDFDLFMEFYDENGDAKVAYDVALAADAGHGALAGEFVDVDNQLARLIDEAFPDRDGDGEVTDTDTQLGYQDGVIDGDDHYAKVHGRLAFAVAADSWETAQALASYQQIVNGPVRTEPDVAAAAFEVSDEELREITTAMVVNSQNWTEAEAAGGSAFGSPTTGQVAAGIAGGGTYTAPGDATWESVPFGAGSGSYDYYQRPIYDNMTFTNVTIPKGTNGLFTNCTFVGVTYLQTEEDCDHVNWNYAGALEYVEVEATGEWIYQPKYPGLEAEAGGAAVASTRVESNNVRFHNCTFIGTISGDMPAEYTHWRNKVQLTGSTRFYIDAEDPDLAEQPDAEAIIDLINALSDEDREELEKSSIILPGWSVDVGNFTNEQAVDPEDTPKVKLKGTIIAGILDVRGTADVFGTLMMTYRPVLGAGPLFYGGQPDTFNTTIGYFGPTDGDGEGDDDTGSELGFGEITLRYNPDAKLPDGIPWPIVVEAQPLTYVEGGSM